MRNKIMLITYPDSFGKNLKEQKENQLVIIWTKDEYQVRLDADLMTNQFTISYLEVGETRVLSL